VTRPRLTIRARLALLCTGLFAACGAIVVAITYALVAHLPLAGSSAVPPRAAYVISCRDDLKKANLDPERRAQCEESVRVLGDAFSDGVDQGAQRQRDKTLANLLWYSLGTLGAVSLLAAFAGWFVAGRVLRPIHQITAAARTASEHNLSARVALTGPRDELRELATTFDEMLGRLEAAFEGQRRFIANASHELRTPLTVMRASVDVVLAKPAPTSEELHGMGRDVRAAVDQAQSLIDALLTLARNEYGLTVHEQVDLATVAEDVLDSVDPGDRHRQVSLRPALTSGDPVLLERLVANLVDNATRLQRAGRRPPAQHVHCGRPGDPRRDKHRPGRRARHRRRAVRTVPAPARPHRRRRLRARAGHRRLDRRGAPRHRRRASRAWRRARSDHHDAVERNRLSRAVRCWRVRIGPGGRG